MCGGGDIILCLHSLSRVNPGRAMGQIKHTGNLWAVQEHIRFSSLVLVSPHVLLTMIVAKRKK